MTAGIHSYSLRSRFQSVLCSSLALTLLSAASPMNAQQAPFTPWMGAAAVSETTSAIMARNRILKPSVNLLNKIERENEEREHARQNPASPFVSQWPPLLDGTSQGGIAPSGTAGRAEALKMPGSQAKFLGGTLADTLSFPPDTMGAAGPTQFLVGINGRISVYSKAGALGALNTTMDNFFASVMTPASDNFTSDPRVRYDRLTQRWFVIIIDVPYPFGGAPNRVLIAMSDGPTITGSTVWSFFYFRHDQVSPAGDANRFADYPSLGIDANALYIGVNLFSTANGFFSGTTGFVVRKSSLISGGPIVATAFRGLVPNSNSAGPFAPTGVDNDDPAASEGYFIGVDNLTFGTLMVRRVSDPGGTPSISANISITIPSTYFPVKVPHLGNTNSTSGYLDALDDRLFAAQIHRNRLTGVSTLTTCHNIRVNTSGQSSSAGTRNAVRWYEFGSMSATPTLIQGGTIYDGAGTDPNSIFIPTIAMSGQGRMVIGSSFSGNAIYASALIAERFGSTPLGTFDNAVTAKAGAAAYNPPNDPGGSYGRRWGDYSFTCIDPADDMTIWSIQQFTNSSNSYGVEVVKILAPPPAAISSISPNNANPGTTLNIAVTGTSSAESGFYSPDTLWLYTNKLAASFSGSGITVNNVTFTDPTHVTLNVTVAAGAAGGARNLTITNPDGQAVTANGIFTVNASTVTPDLSVPNISGVIGETVVLKAILSNGGTGISGKPISIKVDSVEVPGSPMTTDGNGLASLNYTLAEGSIGPHTISATFAGDAGYGPASGSGSLTVSKADTALTVPAASGYPGQSVALKALLARTSDVGALAGRSVAFKVGITTVGSAITDAAGLASKNYTIPSGTVVGTVLSITATFSGDTNYNSSSGTGDLTVKTKTTLTTTSVTGIYGATVNLKATLKAGTTAVPGGSVRFKIDGETVGTATTDASGIALLPHLLDESVGAHTLKSEFDGDANLAPAIGTTATLTVKAITTTITVTAVSAIVDSTATLKATLKAGATLLSGKSVEFLIDGNSIGSVVTDGAGIALLSHTISESIGTHTLTAKFAGDAIYAPSTGNGTLTVKKADTKTVASALTGKPGQTISLKATVKVGSTPVVGADVSFKVNSIFVGTGVTDSTGLAVTPYFVPEGVGSANTILAEYAGDDTHNPSSGSATLTIAKASSKVTADVITRAAGTMVAFGAKLTRTTDSAALAGRQLDFYDAAGTTLLGSSVTDATGRATITLTAPAIGVTVKYLVKFAGDANYLASSGTGSIKGS